MLCWDLGTKRLEFVAPHYQASFTFNVGTTIQFKFVQQTSGNTTWEDGANRQFTMVNKYYTWWLKVE